MWVCMLVGGEGRKCRMHGLVGGSLAGWVGGGLLGREDIRGVGEGVWWEGAGPLVEEGGGRS